MKKTRRKFSANFKAQVVLEAIKERETLAELSRKFEVHANIISNWKQEFLTRSFEIFEKEPQEKIDEKEQEKLYAKIGQLEMERDFLKKNLKKIGL
jgi:transposase